MAKETRFRQGQSGNPKGRPKGSKDKRTRYREMLQEHADDLIKKAVEMAKHGDTTMMKACLDRIVSPYRSISPSISISNLDGTLTEQGQKIIEAMGRSEISPTDAAQMLSAVAAQSKIVEIESLEKRIAELEKRDAN